MSFKHEQRFGFSSENGGHIAAEQQQPTSVTTNNSKEGSVSTEAFVHSRGDPCARPLSLTVHSRGDPCARPLTHPLSPSIVGATLVVALLNAMDVMPPIF